MKTIKILFITFLLFTLCKAQAQTWGLSGNSISSTSKFGSTNAEPISMYTYDTLRVTLTKTGKLGHGLTSPRAWHELSYCPPLNNSESGLIITYNRCNGNGITMSSSLPDLIGGGFSLSGTQGESSSGFTIPFSYLTGNNTNVLNPIYTSESPMFWVRTQTPPGLNPGTSGIDEFNTKFIVLPDGSCGINISQPRAALDVRGSQATNRPAVIIGSRALGTSVVDPLTGLFQYHTQQVQFVPSLADNAFNMITEASDQGMFYSDGKGVDGSNLDGAFVIAPWIQNDSTSRGIRIDKSGNVGIGYPETNGKKLAVNGDATFNGFVTCKNELKVQKINVAWPDYVFRVYESDKVIPYSISDMKEFVLKNHHLPEIRSEKEVVEDGMNVVDDYVNLLKQVEILSLHIIELQSQIDLLNAQVEKQD